MFLYKRAQIFVGDMWGAFGGLGLGAFHDIGRLTTFADYRVPVVLRQLGALRYSPALAAKVRSASAQAHMQGANHAVLAPLILQGCVMTWRVSSEF